MALSKTLTNPYVLGAGALVAVGVFLLSNRDEEEGDNPIAQWAAGVREYNMVAMEYATEVSLAAYDLEATKVENSTRRILGMLATAENMKAISAQERLGKLISDNGVINTQIQAQAALDIAREQAAADRDAARYAYKSNKKDAELDFFGDAIGTVGKVIGSIF